MQWPGPQSGDVQAVVKCRDLVEGLMGEFLQVTIQLWQAHCMEARDLVLLCGP